MALTLTMFGSINSGPGQADGQVGTRYFAGVRVTGGTSPYVLSVSVGALPSGLSLLPNRIGTDFAGTDAFEITGVPLAGAIGTTTFTILATDAIGATGTVATQIQIKATQNFEMGMPPGNLNAAYSFQLNNAFAISAFVFAGGPGGTPPFTYSLLWSGPDPGGMSLSSAGLFSGTPASRSLIPFNTARFNASISITDSGANQLSTNNSFFVQAPGPTLTCGNPPDGHVSSFYTHTLALSGGTGPYVFVISAGALPPDLAIDSASGIISGNPVAAGSFSFTVLVTDSTSATSSVTCSILIRPSNLDIAGGMGCLPECFDYCEPTSVESMEPDSLGGDPAIVAGIVGALLLGGVS